MKKTIIGKEEMIKRIYEIISDKTLRFGCEVFDNEHGEYGYITRYRAGLYNITPINNQRVLTTKGKWITETIGHPVMIGDVLDWMGSKGYFYFCIHNKQVKFDGFQPVFQCDGVRTEEQKKQKLFGTDIYCKSTDYHLTLGNLRDEKREPIDQQSIELIKFVYDLLPKK